MLHSTASRMFVLSAGLLALLTAMSWRLIYLQAYKHDDYSEVVRKAHRQKLILPARRGAIYDRNGELLAADRQVRHIIADRKKLTHLPYATAALARAEEVSKSDIEKNYSSKEIVARYIELLSSKLARPLGYHHSELAEKLSNTRKNDIYLKNDYEEEKAETLEDFLSDNGLRGIAFRRDTKRFYSSDERLVQVVGYVDNVNSGKEGIEKSFDEVLTGKPGYRYVEYDRLGNEVPVFRGESKAATHGHSIELSIDMRLQEIVESSLDGIVQEYHPEKAVAIITRPFTGEILAMAARPHFNRSEGKKGTVGIRRNIAISDAYEPGSTFKVVAFAGAFDRKLVWPTTSIFCHNGSLKDKNLHVTLRDHSSYGNLTATEVLAESSNIGTYQVARRLGSQNLYDTQKRFGFGKKTGIELTSESAGIVHPLENWSGTTLSRLAIGYEVSVTPLQMIMAMGAIANGGYLMKPSIKSSIVDHKGKIVEKFERQVVSKIMEQHSARWLRQALGQVIESGTGKSANVPGIPVDDPKNQISRRYGGVVAAPWFSKIADRAADYLQIDREASQPDGKPKSIVADSLLNTLSGHSSPRLKQ